MTYNPVGRILVYLSFLLVFTLLSELYVSPRRRVTAKKMVDADVQTHSETVIAVDTDSEVSDDETLSESLDSNDAVAPALPKPDDRPTVTLPHDKFPHIFKTIISVADLPTLRILCCTSHTVATQVLPVMFFRHVKLEIHTYPDSHLRFSLAAVTRFRTNGGLRVESFALTPPVPISHLNRYSRRSSGKNSNVINWYLGVREYTWFVDLRIRRHVCPKTCPTGLGLIQEDPRAEDVSLYQLERNSVVVRHLFASVQQVRCHSVDRPVATALFPDTMVDRM